MSLKSNILAGIIAGSNAALVPNLRAVSVYNRCNTARRTMTYTPSGRPASGKRRMVVYDYKKIGSGQTNFLQYMINNFFFDVTATGGRGVATGNDFTVVSASVQRNFAGAGVTQMTKGGLSTFVVTSGEKNVLFDPVIRTDNIGNDFWFRIEIEVDYGQYIPVCEVNDTAAGNSAWLFDPGINTWNKTEVNYPTYPQWSSGSAGNTQQVIGFQGILLGKFTSGDPLTLHGSFDSLGNNGHDGSGQTSYFMKMCIDNNIANILTGRIGGQSNIVTDNDYSTHLVKYCNAAMENFGTNSDTETVAQMQARKNATWAALKAAAVPSFAGYPFKVICALPLLRTNAGNTAVASNAWNANGSIEQMSAWIDTQKNLSNGPSIVVDPTLGANAVRKSNADKGVLNSDYYLWAASTNNGDGLHLSSTGATKCAGNTAPQMLPVF